MAVDDDGSLWAIGNNSYGQLGTGDKERRLEFTRVPLPARVVAVGCGDRHTLTADDPGALWVAGGSALGQSGAGHLGHIDRFARVEVGSGAAELTAQLTGGLSVEMAYETARSVLAAQPSAP